MSRRPSSSSATSATASRSTPISAATGKPTTNSPTAGVPHLSGGPAQAEKSRARLAAIWSDPLSLDPARKAAARHARDRRTSRRRLQGAGEHEAIRPRRWRCSSCAASSRCSPRTSGCCPKTVVQGRAGAVRGGPANVPSDVGQLWEAMNAGGYAPRHRAEGPAVQRRVLPQPRGAAARPRGDRRTAPGGEPRLARCRARRSSARCSNRRWTRTSAASSARITRRAPMSSGWSWRRSSSRCAPNGRNVVSRRARDGSKSTGDAEGRARDGARFHDKLCATRVLDPACGTGNFLYVALEMMKRLEGEVLEAFADLGGQEALTGSTPHRRSASVPRPGDQPPRRRHRRIGAVDRLSAMAFPHPRRPASEPILKAFKNIQIKDAVLKADGERCAGRLGQAGHAAGAGRSEIEVYRYAIRGGRTGRRQNSSSAIRRSSGEQGYSRAGMGEEYAEALWASASADERKRRFRDVLVGSRGGAC